MAENGTKQYKYLIFWWAQKDGGFANGTLVTTMGSPFTEAKHNGVRDLIRKETGFPNATIMSFSEYAPD